MLGVMGGAHDPHLLGGEGGKDPGPLGSAGFREGPGEEDEGRSPRGIVVGAGVNLAVLRGCQRVFSSETQVVVVRAHDKGGLSQDRITSWDDADDIGGGPSLFNEPDLYRHPGAWDHEALRGQSSINGLL